MKLGTQTGSLVNHLYSRAVIGQPEPELGMGATLLAWTDRHPATVTDTFLVGKTRYVTVQDDDAKRLDRNGMSEAQEYEYTPNPKGRLTTFRRNKDGMWEEVEWNAGTNRWRKRGGYGLRLGERRKYYDFSF